MGVPPLMDFSIALFTGMVAVTFVPPVRKAIRKPAEAMLWMALVVSCVLGVTSVTDKGALDTTAAAVWGAEHVVSTIFGLLAGAAGAWFDQERFAIADWFIVLAGADLLALIVIRSTRRAAPWEPRVFLGEWMEIPLPEPALPVQRQKSHEQPGAAHTLAFAAVATAIWFFEAAAHVRFAARSLYQAAATPATARVIDIRGLLGAQSSVRDIRGEIEEEDSNRTNPMAS